MITDILSAGLKILDRVLPDPVERDKAKAKLLELEANAELEELKAEASLAAQQIAVNAVEAASLDPFVRRWRPAFGWLGVFAFGYAYIGQPLLTWASPALGIPAPPTIQTDDLMVLAGGLLGFGGYRTVEKIRKPRA